MLYGVIGGCYRVCDNMGVYVCMSVVYVCVGRCCECMSVSVCLCVSICMCVCLHECSVCMCREVL